ncbi:phage holin family protein [Collimonas humicola]|uniref:phage holin family protein n=1 Tax=Collimonas humicola TaxID=2825886 RepID=UPI001B8D7424|nr:phage holin family protein [Collimonas humicola]
MTNILTMLALLSYASTCVRLLCYRRGLANHRFHISVAAWFLIVATGTSALEILLGHGHPSFGQAAIAFTLCALVHRAQGNVANIIRSID